MRTVYRNETSKVVQTSKGLYVVPGYLYYYKKLSSAIKKADQMNFEYLIFEMFNGI